MTREKIGERERGEWDDEIFFLLVSNGSKAKLKTGKAVCLVAFKRF